MMKQPEMWKRIIDDNGTLSLFVPVAASLDYDGCMGNTDEAMRLVARVTAENTHLTERQIEAARLKVESRLEPFSTVHYIQSELDAAGEGLTWARDIKPEIMSRSREQKYRERLLTKGAKAVMLTIQERGMYPFSLTYGQVISPYGPEQEWAAREWQLTKVRMTLCLEDLPVVVASRREKAKELVGWFDDRMQAYRLPVDAWVDADVPVYAASVVHIDDKRSALTGWDTLSHAYAVHYLPERDEDIRETQRKGELPRGAHTVRGMGQAATLFAQLSETELVPYFDRTISIKNQW